MTKCLANEKSMVNAWGKKKYSQHCRAFLKFLLSIFFQRRKSIPSLPGGLSQACACVLSCVRLSATPWTLALQAPLSTEFPRQEHWSGLLSPPRGVLPDQVIQLTSLAQPALAGGFFITSATWESLKICGKSWGQSELFISVLINVPDSRTTKLKKRLDIKYLGACQAMSMKAKACQTSYFLSFLYLRVCS